MRLKGTKWSDPQLSQMINMKLLESCMKCYVRYIHPQVVEFNLSRAFLYQNINKACIKSFLVSKPSHETEVCIMHIDLRASTQKQTYTHTSRKKKQKGVCVWEREPAKPYRKFD